MSDIYGTINLPFQGVAMGCIYPIPKALPWAELKKAFSLNVCLKGIINSA
ncbi:hypothetical protein [Labilibaculum manganireducens]|nr:hypothetical protein [Labilibaculum manganireducens]